jgi:hypothetical protein
MKELGKMELELGLKDLKNSEKTQEMVASMWRATARSEKFLFGEYQELMARKRPSGSPSRHRVAA